MYSGMNDTMGKLHCKWNSRKEIREKDAGLTQGAHFQRKSPLIQTYIIGRRWGI